MRRLKLGLERIENSIIDWARIAVAALVVLSLGAVAEDRQVVEQEIDLSSWSAVTVGVGDLDEALDLWVKDFGFVIDATREGPDDDLALAWSIEPDDIVRQALVRSRNTRHGMLHLVEFADPEPAVRSGAQVFDLLPKNLDVYVDDMPARLAELSERGRTFRNDTFSEVTAPSGITFREMHMPGHDEINVVLLEILGGAEPLRRDGIAGVGPLILIVGDATKERSFFERVMRTRKLTDNVLEGPEIEKMVGLPPGAALDVSIWGRRDQPYGQIELIEYRGVDGENRYPRARPTSRGILHVSYEVSSLEPMKRRLDQHRIDFSEHGTVETLYGTGAVMSFFSPAGFRMELHERRQDAR